MVDPLEPELKQTLLGCCSLVIATDGAGALQWTLGRDDTSPEELALALDLIASAITRLGRDRTASDLDTVFIRFADELLMIVSVEGGRVALVADAGVTPGLLFSHVRRLQTALLEAA